jgi:NitT/TauT family transport system ATP-binding protein
LLSQKLSDGAASEVLKTVIEWSRYAEVFAFDVNSGHISLDNPGESDQSASETI